jgi:hypothetical protein
MANNKKHTEYDSAFCEKVVKLMREGASIMEVARELNARRETLWSWRKNHPEFKDAIETGLDYSQGWWEKMGRLAINDKQFNATVWYMNMKNRFGWRDKKDLTTNGKDLPTPLLNNVSSNNSDSLPNRPMK